MPGTRAFTWGLGLCSIAFAARPAAAQLCHAVAPIEAHREHAGTPHHLQPGLTMEAAAVEGGDYQGVAPSLQWHHDFVGAAVAAPIYRLRLGDDTVYGPGDVKVQGHLRIVGDARTGAGLVLAVGLPTGSAEDRLGMGHVMAMPGLFGVATFGKVAVLSSVSLGKSLGEGDHAAGAHGGDADAADAAAQDAHAGHGEHDETAGHAMAPIVNPANTFEIGGTLRVTLALSKLLDVYALGLVAFPIVDDGVTRAAAGPGARLTLGAVVLSADVQIGLAGDPFDVRGVLGAGYVFSID